jgi:hypothetical protein
MEYSIFLAFVGIGLTYFLWGMDKLLEVYEIGKIPKKLMGLFYFILGVILLVFAFLNR